MKNFILIALILLSSIGVAFTQNQPESFRKIQRKQYKQLKAERNLSNLQWRALKEIRSKYRIVYRDLNDMPIANTTEFERLRKNELKEINLILLPQDQKMSTRPSNESIKKAQLEANLARNMR